MTCISRFRLWFATSCSKKATNSWLVLALECYSPLGEGPANEIRVVVNWFTELERLVPTK